MLKTKHPIINTKHFLLLWFVLFALSPCVVKEVMFSVTNAEYAKPLNKSKTVAQSNSCQYSQGENQQISIVKQWIIDKQTEPAEVAEHLVFVVRNNGIKTNYSKTYSGNSPPKYILYKRLKLHVA